MNRKSLLLFALMALFAPLAVMGQGFDHLTYFTQTSTDDFKHGTPYLVDIADGSVSLQYRMSSVAEWASTTNMPQTLKQHQVVTWRDYVILVGGSSNGTNAVNTVYRATKQDNGISGWSGLNGMPVALKDMAVVATQTRLIVMGGRNENGVSDKIYYAPFNNDGSIGSWTESEVALPNPTYGLRAVLAMGNIYLLGGTAVIDSVETVTANTYLLKVNADGDIASVAEATSLPEARNGHAVAFYDSKIFVTGGCDATATATNTVWSSTVSTSGTLGEWTVRTEMPKALYDHTAVFANGVLAVLGGNDGTIVNDEFYYTTLDATALTWTLSDIYMPARYTQGASFAFGDKIFFCGGEALSGAINSNVAYMPVTTTNKPIRKTAFVSEPIYVGSAKTMQQLDYTITLGTGTSCEILYRTAGTNKVFGNWTSKSSNNPATINQSKCYIQYMFRFSATSSCTENLSLDDVTLMISGYTQLAGNLNDISTLTLTGSPYWVTQDVSFTSGTHNIEAGVTIYFRANTKLTVGQASVNFNGTSANPITLTYEDTGEGLWNGVKFEDASDNGVSSVMNYTIIEKVNQNSSQGALYLYYTNQPTMDHCTFRNSAYGLDLTNSNPTVTNCTMSYNRYDGLWLSSSAPTCTSCTISYNQRAGIYYANSNFNATFNGVTSKNNLYGIYSCTPDHSFTFGSSDISLTGNTGAGIAIAGGRIASDQTWNKYTGGYALLGNVEIYGGTPKLTIQAGTTIKGNTGCGLYVGAGGSQGGMLYAVGTTSQLITFTSLNGEVGGWDGVRFRDGSDYSSTSSMRRCVVEKGTTNLVCENTNQPTAKWCTFQDARDQNVYLNNASISLEGSTLKNAPRGLWVNSSAPSLVSVVFENHSEACVYHNNECYPTYSDCTMKDSQVGIRYWTCNRDFTIVDNVSFENNWCNIGMPGGRIDTDRSWVTNTYAIFDDLHVGRYYNYSPNHCRLTLAPGSILKFAEGKRMDISEYHYYGELYAEGSSSQPITFTSLNGEIGGWNGLVFNGESDDFTGASSSLKHCIIEKANERNLHLGSTYQPGLIEDCIFRQSVQHCVYMGDSRDTLRNCAFEDNAGYTLYYNNAYYVGELENLTFIGNLYNGVTVDGGHISEDRTWNAYTYFVLNDIRVGRYYGYSPNHCRLTLAPGTALKFASGKRMDIGGYWSNTYYGELYAEGTAEQPITFTSLNGEIGGWNGLVFNGQSDDFGGASSSLKHCIMEKGNEFNLYTSGTTLPEIENCIFQSSSGYGICLGSEYCQTIKNTVVTNNGGHGIKSDGALIGMINVQVLNNGGYGMYYTNAHYLVGFENVSIEGNQEGQIALDGGHISDDRNWNAYTYDVLNDIRVGRYYGYSPNHCRLTLAPGTALKFASGKRMDIGGYWSNTYYGELYAEGTAEQPITFTSLNGEIGGWNGLVFNSQSDDFSGASSSLKHCIIEKGNERNLHLGSTYQPGLIEDCIFRQSVQHCVYMGDSRDTLRNCAFEDNAGYTLYYNNAYYVGELENLTFIGNLYNGVTVDGGHISEDRTWNAYTYFVLNDIRVGRYYGYSPNHCRLTLAPGTALKFASGKRMDIGGYWSNTYYGELYAEGTSEQPITFTSMNGEVGGWNGLYFDPRSDDFTNASSSLKHCIIENGNEYNLYSSGTTLPEIEHCVFQNSNGYGLRFGNEYNKTIKNTVIKNNASHGIYITDVTPFTLGGAPEYACSIYGNGGYAVYQDGSSNINMSYNFWGQPGYRQVEDEFVYDKLDDPNKGRITVNPTCWFPMENFNRVRGYFTYNETQLMAGKRVKIINANGTQQAAVNTNSNGRFTFSNYSVSVYNTINTDFGIDILAGVNATDALLVMRHFVHLDTLTGSQLAAADVNLSGNINGTDAMLIMRRAIDEEFPSGDYYYYSPSGMSITENNVEYDLSFLCYGDVNGSYTLPSRDNGIELLHEGQLLAGSYQEMELPVSIKQAVEMGALTLRFGYPEEYIEIEGVVLAATGESLLFTANEGELTTVWFSLQPLALAENDGLIIIKVRTKDLSDINEPVAFSLSAYSEMADGNAQVLEGVAIAMPDIVTQTLGVSGNATTGVALSLYPNPAKDVCTMVYQLPEAGRVTVSVYNTMGVKVMDVADFRQEEGRHELRLSTASLAAGMYTCRITFEGESSWVKTTKLTIEK